MSIYFEYHWFWSECMENFSVIGLIIDATIVVKFVMIVLLVSSVITWALIARQIKLRKTLKSMREAFDSAFWSGEDLDELFEKLKAMQRNLVSEELVFYQAYKEYQKLQPISAKNPSALIEGVERASCVAIQQEEKRLSHNISLLATIGSVSPYVGLLGTVWGIMHTFLAFSSSSHLTLQVIAPSIAEALIATAMGLLVAIPSVVAYNRFVTLNDILSQDLERFSQEFLVMVHRETQLALI